MATASLRAADCSTLYIRICSKVGTLLHIGFICAAQTFAQTAFPDTGADIFERFI